MTFEVLREALWALDAIEREWIEPGSVSGFRKIAIARMKAEPRHWAKYHARGAALDHDLQCAPQRPDTLLLASTRRLPAHRR